MPYSSKIMYSSYPLNKGLLFLMNLSLILSFLLLSFWGYFTCFFFYCDFAPFNWNHFWNKTSRTMTEWHTFFSSYFLVVPSIMFFGNFSHPINSLTNWKYMISTQLIDFPWFSMEIIIANLLLKYYTLSLWYLIGRMATII